ncbi:MAG: bifunctional molybdenum cofactor biosynthesis protein MoaC/MoaB [bacterium]|nr:bifunctional molybdenum cofactor biosynthesis protein MoaC/MoaB [bacterium]
MIDVSGKRVTLRRAVATAIVHVKPETADVIRRGGVPKGDVREMTRATALLGIKQTPDLLPFCHRIPIDHAAVELEVRDTLVEVRVEVAAIARTGVEVEAMTGASIAALNVYDMVKPIDQTAHIGEVRVLEKHGGKTDFHEAPASPIKAAVIVVSDSVSAGKAQDSAGATVRTKLEAHGIEVSRFEVVPDEAPEIAQLVTEICDKESENLVFTVGGTGLGERDTTPEALRGVIEREIPGLGETMRAYGRDRTPLADLSRSIAGQRGKTLIVAMPGSRRAAAESVGALLPWIVHGLKVMDRGYRHGK